MAGRRRDARLDDAIRRAAWTVLVGGGSASFTVEAVAELVGVPKSTIYKRWPSRLHLLALIVTEALVAGMSDLPPTDDLRAFLMDQLHDEITTARSPEGRAAAQLVLAAIDAPHPAVDEVLEALHHRRRRYEELLRSGVATGQLPPNTDIELTVDLLLGAVWGRVLWTQADPHDLAERIVGTFLPAEQ